MKHGWDINGALNHALNDLPENRTKPNQYTAISCINKSPSEEEENSPSAQVRREKPYEELENELQLEKQRFQQMHEDRVNATREAQAESDRFIQENADKLPKKTPEMEESDRRIQSIPLVIKGQSHPNPGTLKKELLKKIQGMNKSNGGIQNVPPKVAGNFTA